MDWPCTPVERLASFVPRFCPRRECPEHLRTEPGYRFRRHGYTTRRGRPLRRFRCRTCRSTFTRQAFSTTYYLKRPELLRPVAAGLLAGSAHRQLARTLGCAPSTVTRLAARIGRHSMLLLTRALDQLEDIDEPVVLDHFETFEFSQDLPFGIATPVGHRSWFVYGPDPVPHRRTGRVTPAQRRRLARRPARPSRGGYEASAGRVFSRLLERTESVLFYADDHPAYGRAASRPKFKNRVRLVQFANPARGPKGSTPSEKARRRDRAMFPADQLHMLLRHSQAAHRRETIAFGRRLNALMERIFPFAIWRNFVKGRSERRPDRTTPAMVVGLTDRPWSWTRVLAQRLFPDREGIRGVWNELYRRDWTTPTLVNNRRHELRLAY